MKTLIQMAIPVVKATLAVMAFILGLGWGSYQAVSSIALAEASRVKEEVKELRAVDMQHINKRFDTLEELIKDKR